MKKWLIPVGIIVVLVAIIAFWSIGIKNNGLKYSQAVNKEWGNVQTAYQRRNDLIGNLVNTVKGAADFEKSTLTAVIEARAKATSVTIDPSNVTPEQLAQFNQAQSGVSSSLSRLLVSVEQYPTLKANRERVQIHHRETTLGKYIIRHRAGFRRDNAGLRDFPGSHRSPRQAYCLVHGGNFQFFYHACLRHQ